MNGVAEVKAVDGSNSQIPEAVIRLIEYESSDAKCRSQLVRAECVFVGPSLEQRHMISITISLTPDHEQKLEELARQSGKDPSDYVHDVVTAYLNGAGLKGVKRFEEILAPIW